jgi:hypothetical protein
MKKKSKAQKVIDYLESGKSLSKLECFKMFQYWNLSDIIWKLRNSHGQDYIRTTMAKTTTGSDYAIYQLTNTKHLK